MKYDNEFVDKIEEMRVKANNSYEFMLKVVIGDEEAISEESLRKKAIADEINKEKNKIAYGDGSIGELLSMSDSKTKITEDELEMIMEIIEKNFTGKQFKSKDILPLLPQVNGEPILNNRKLPSRLKKLAEFNRLEDKGGKPKSYTIAE